MLTPKGMNLPGMNLSTPSMTEKILRIWNSFEIIAYDYIALSFVRSPNDVIELKTWLSKR